MQPYEKAISEIRAELLQLDTLTGDGHLSRAAATDLKNLVEQKLAELNQTIELKKKGEEAEALKLVATNRGKNLMDEIRALIDAVVTEKKARVRSLSRERTLATYVRNWAFGFTAIFLILFLYWTYRRVNKEFDARTVVAEEAQRQRELVAVTLSSIGDAVIVTDEVGRITFMNAIAASLTGWTEEDARGQLCEEIFHIVNESTPRRVENPVEKVASHGRDRRIGQPHTPDRLRRRDRNAHIDDSGAQIPRR